MTYIMRSTKKITNLKDIELSFRIENTPDLTSRQIYSLSSSTAQDPFPMLKDIATAGEYDQWELYQILL